MKKDVDNQFLKPIDERETFIGKFDKVEGKNARQK